MSAIRKLAAIAFLLVGSAVLAFLFGAHLVQVRQDAQRLALEGRFAQIGLMLQNYHQDHEAFPPTRYQPKADGPIHSWRVLLVPYIDHLYAEQYQRYDFSQEWNSPANLKALADNPGHFTMNGGGTGSIAHFLAVGEGEKWPSKRPLRSRLIIKGEDRFLLVEYPESDIHWMEPKY